MILMFQLVYAPVNHPLRIEESLLKHNEETRSQKNDSCIHSFLEENTPSSPNPSETFLDLFFKRIHSVNSTTRTAAQRWQSPLPTLLRLRFRQKYCALAKLKVILLKKVYYPDFVSAWHN